MDDTKTLLHAAIDRIGAEHLDELYRVVQEFASKNGAEPGGDGVVGGPKPPDPVEDAVGRKPGLLARLKEIQIDAPADFSTNWGRYADGEHLGE